MDYSFEPSELRIDEYRTSGARRWVNRPFNAVRVTHLPTGLIAESANKRSQYLNRSAAIAKLDRMLKERLFYEPTQTYS
ncbi:peptide chain release factor 2 [Acinetobacter phage MD-2021a]|nr:peptide chain release factor 2 [Acinetobacter phage MD-2021a]CAH1068429.1 peptide chain release factor 2 [Acinetobacter phage MD-2021a]